MQVTTCRHARANKYMDDESILRTSWGPLVQFLPGVALFIWIGYEMVRSDGWAKIFGILLLLGIAAYFATLLFRGLPRQGPCPRCKWLLVTWERSDHDMLCPMCCSYFDADDGRLYPIRERDRIRNIPTFAVPTPWKDLRSVSSPTISVPTSIHEALMESAMKARGGDRSWEPTWPAGCCVCGHPEMRSATHVITVVKQLTVRMEEIRIFLKNIPYCGDHDEGVKLGNATFSDESRNMRFALLFKSFAYRNAFFDLNPGEFYEKPIIAGEVPSTGSR